MEIELLLLCGRSRGNIDDGSRRKQIETGEVGFLSEITVSIVKVASAGAFRLVSTMSRNRESK